MGGCRSSVAALAFLEQDSAAGSGDAGTSSPLLILTEDRQYHMASPGCSADVAVAVDARAELTVAQGAQLSLCQHGLLLLRCFMIKIA